jgi:hypothetical protein
MAMVRLYLSLRGSSVRLQGTGLFLRGFILFFVDLGMSLVRYFIK